MQFFSCAIMTVASPPPRGRFSNSHKSIEKKFGGGGYGILILADKENETFCDVTWQCGRTLYRKGVAYVIQALKGRCRENFSPRARPKPPHILVHPRLFCLATPLNNDTNNRNIRMLRKVCFFIFFTNYTSRPAKTKVEVNVKK